MIGAVEMVVKVKAPCPRCGRSFLNGGSLKTHIAYCGQQDRFWAKVNKEAADGCWVYTGYRQKFGHGWLGSRGLAHRFAWTILCGPIPQGKCLLHRCDNPPCVNPAHLFIGDRTMNKLDSVAKGRHAKGEQTRRSKLTESKVREIRAAYHYKRAGKTGTAGESNAVELAAKYGVTRGTIVQIASGYLWGHVK